MSTVVVATVKSNSSSPPAFQNTSGTEIGTLCRAWVNFNGAGTVAIRAQFNVSSITDNGTGNYTVNFTTALADENYNAVCTSGDPTSSTTNTPLTIQPSGTATTAYQASAFRLWSKQGTAVVDCSFINVAIFR